MKNWYRKFLAIPFSKMNCAEFVEHVLREQFGINYSFPQSGGSFFKESQQIREEVPNYCYKAGEGDIVEEGDLVLMHGKRRMCHVGLFVKDGRRDCVLHTERSKGCSMLHEIRDLSRYGFSVEGFYKWRK